MKIGHRKIGNLNLIDFVGDDGIPNVKVELSKKEYRDDEVIVLPHYKPLNKIDHFDHKRKINSKIKKVEGFPIGNFVYNFSIRISESKSIMYIPFLRVRKAFLPSNSPKIYFNHKRYK